ncbi:MAG: RNase adapter RapZ [Terriglobia bacterium]
MKDLEFTIITGLSGAGKTEAIRCFEDIGYFCIDNLPPSLILKMAELSSLPGSKVRKVALVSDVRGGEFFDALFEALKALKKQKVNSQILFLEASDEALVKRFKETRRRHPLASGGQIVEGIRRERDMLGRLRGQADMIIDTSDSRAAELRDKIRTSFLGVQNQKGVLITVVSFGFKYGLPRDADLTIDVRFLPNPNYVPEFQDLSGQDQQVKDYVLDRTETKKFLTKYHGLLGYLLPFYVAEGKTHLTVAMGCTGGMHRSVALAEETGRFLKNGGYNVIVRHRDIGRDVENRARKASQAGS